MRRYGVVVYFGFTCIGMLVMSDRIHRHLRAGAAERRTAQALLALCALLPLLGLAHVLLPALWPALDRDALENVTEWWGGAIFTAFFLVLAWAWRSTGFRLNGRVDGTG